MNKQKWLILVATLALIGAAGGLLSGMRARQRLGAPAVKTTALAGTQRLRVVLPEQVPGYESKALEPEKIELDTLPQDTSFGKRVYQAPDGFWTQVGVVLMGADRTSLHKPEYCLQGQGWHLDLSASAEVRVHMERPCVYDLPVRMLLASRQVTEEGNTQTQRAVYVYWFVAENEYTASHNQRMWWLASDLLRTGVLQRWAYVSYLSVCHPGQEEATFERIKKLIVASVPEFQLTPSRADAVATARP